MLSTIEVRMQSHVPFLALTWRSRQELIECMDSQDRSEFYAVLWQRGQEFLRMACPQFTDDIRSGICETILAPVHDLMQWV